MAIKHKAKGQAANPVKQRKNSAKESERNPFLHLALMAVRLIDLTAKLEIKGGKLPENPKLETHISVGPSLEPGKILVDSTLSLDAKSSEDESTLKIVVHFQCIYHAEGIEVSELESVGNVIGKGALLIMWPHFREVIQSITSKMAIKPIVLPMFLTDAPGAGSGTGLTIQGKK